MRGRLPSSRSAVRQAFNEDLKKRWKKSLEASPRWPKIRRIDPTAPSQNFRRITSHLPRQHVALLTQLRTGHIPLQRHMHHIRPEDFTDATCPACGQREETVVHYLIQCRSYSDSRHRLEQAVGRSGRDITKLLNNKAMFPHLFTFINETQRFHTSFGDVGLPKTSGAVPDEPRYRRERTNRHGGNTNIVQARRAQSSTRNTRTQRTVRNEHQQMAETMHAWLQTARTT